MSDGTVPRYILQDGRSVNVARCQDANGNIHILTSGCEVVSSSDYDALRTQAREMADVLRAILAADARGQGLPFKEAMDRAQAVLKEGG